MISLIILVAVMVLPYLGLPFLIYFIQRAQATFAVDPINMEYFPDGPKDWVLTQKRAFERLGFKEVAFLRNVGAVANVTSYFMLLANRETSDSAMITMIIAGAGNAAATNTYYVEFSTKFTDDTAIMTNNSGQAGAFLAVDTHRSFRLPSVTDPTLLYRVHQHVIAEYAAGKTKKMAPPGEEIAALQRSVRESYERQVRLGQFRRDGEEAFLPTLPGAFRMTWLHLFPFKQIQAATNRRQEQILLSQIKNTPPVTAGSAL